MRRFLVILGRLLLIMLVILAVVILTNYTFLKRGLSYPVETEITASDWYTPKSIISGNNNTNYLLSDSLTIDQSALDSITQYAGDRRSSALLVMHKGKLQLEKYWGESHKQSTSNSMSMAKSIISMLIGIAIQEGNIGSINDLASSYIPEWKSDNRSTITIKDLLYMQSGLVNEDDTSDFFSDIVAMYIGSNVVKTALDVPLAKSPGSVFEYNNVNTQILAIILERATGESLSDYTSSKLWQPLGANNAGWWLDKEDGMPKAFCCFFAEAEDWLILGKLLLQGGNWDGKQLVPKDWVDNMLIQSPHQVDYGLHIWTNYEDGGHRQDNRSESYLAKNYSIDGANKQQVIIIPDHDLIIVRIGNKPNEWDESFIPNTLVRNLMQ